jgi:hypothetical protein
VQGSFGGVEFPGEQRELAEEQRGQRLPCPRSRPLRDVEQLAGEPVRAVVALGSAQVELLEANWVDEHAGKVFCLVEAADADTAHTVHREAHGLVADEIYPVEQG